MPIENLIIFQKVYDFLLWLEKIINSFAKNHKYTLGAQLENETLNLLKQIIRTNIERDKKKGIEECLIYHETIKVLIRLANDFRGTGTFSLKQYEFAAVRLDEIGRLLNGWHAKFS
ncbi:MAG: four helix bundle protein [Patescibacteria group bacterium]